MTMTDQDAVPWLTPDELEARAILTVLGPQAVEDDSGIAGIGIARVMITAYPAALRALAEARQLLNEAICELPTGSIAKDEISCRAMSVLP